MLNVALVREFVPDSLGKLVERRARDRTRGGLGDRNRNLLPLGVTTLVFLALPYQYWWMGWQATTVPVAAFLKMADRWPWGAS